MEPAVYSPGHVTPPIDRRLVERYAQNGFIVIENMISAQKVDCLRREVERLRHDNSIKSLDTTITEPGYGDVRSIFDVHKTSPVVSGLARDSRLTAIARYLLADDVYIYQSRLNYKPGFRGKEFYWHSDFETWHVEDGMPAMRALSMSITLTENEPGNGPLMLIPGSHRRFVVCEGVTPEKNYKSSLQQQEYGIPTDECLRDLVDEGGITTVACEPGSVIIFDCNLMHGSASNITPHPRSNAFFVYNAISNRPGEPFCGREPRPDYLCARKHIAPVTSGHSNE